MPSEDPGFLAEIGLRVPDLVAGFMGGVVNALIFRKSDPWSFVASVVVGGLASNYLSSPVGHYIGTTAPTTGFVVGLGGMALCQGIVEAAKSWRPFPTPPPPKGKPDVEPRP